MSGQDHKGQEPVNPPIFPPPPVVLLLFLVGGYGLQGHRESVDDHSRAAPRSVCPGKHYQTRRGYLTQRFGPDYVAYRKKVRRWF
jgi:hypothetical protein